MAKDKIFKGGEFLICDPLPDEVFVPEDFSDDQRLIAKSAQEFGSGEVFTKREELEQLNPELIRKLIRKAGELGFLGADIPEIYGGEQLDKISAILITEKIHHGVGGYMVAFGVQTGIGSLPIVLFGTPEQKKKFLPKLASGETIGAYALTEPEHGSDALGAETTAVLSDDGKYYILNGQKQFITNSGFADLFITYAQVDEKKFTSFIVERGSEGIDLGEEEKKMGMHGSSTRSVFFQDVRVPIENVLGEVGRGHVVALNTLNVGRYKLGAFTLGASKIILEDGIRWAKNRIQFGRPICEFGLIKHKIAEMTIKIYVSECMLYRTAGLLNLALGEVESSNEDVTKKTGEIIRRYALECSIIKIYCSELLEFVSDECVQVMGGYGYIQENPIEASYRDSRINRIWEGTNEINKLIIFDMLVKTAMKGELPILDAIRKLTKDIISFRPDMTEAEGILEKEKRMLSMAKKILLLGAGAAVQKYMEKINKEQEIISLLSEIIIEIFAMESALIRARKKYDKAGEEESKIDIQVAQVYINDAFSKVETNAKQVFAAISQGEELRTQLMALKKLSKHTPINTIKPRRSIADHAIRVGRYSLTKL